MALRKLPLAVQSKFSASKQINTFKAAVEELVYNAFDADSRSIAIRIHIQENFIQVVDNGHGVDKNDFNLLGERYSTSKYDQPMAKTNPNYGYCGQTLANIIEVSESVKITSRFKDSEEAWVKYFYKGKQKGYLVKSTRPSVGTTIEIEGFLYNMPIQRRTIKGMQELQRIKAFLGQMSVVHCDTSISLRDNEENVIIFKIHKNRDIPQTLTSILGVDISNFQELHVEKNQYKVTGFIQKMNTESHGTQWIYLNKRIIDNCNLHKIVNQNFNRSTMIKKISKIKNLKNDEDKFMFNNKLPDYFIFITCPCDDYDIISNPKQSILEFKNWNHVDKLLEKLILFFNGSINVGNKHTVPVESNKNDKDVIDMRNQVKQIMNKILGSYQRKHNGSQLHNGVKGKIVKRKPKKSLKGKPINKLKVVKENDNFIPDENHRELELLKPLEKNCNNDNTILFKSPKKKPLKMEIAAHAPHPPSKPQPPTKPPNNSHTKTEFKKTKHKIFKKHPVISKFEKQTDEVKNRCHMLAKVAENILDFGKKRNCKIFTNEIIQYNTIVTDKKSVSIRKKIDEIIIHEYFPLPQRNLKTNHNHEYVDNVLKSYDLIQPVANNVMKKLTNKPVPQKHKISPPADIHEINIPECDLNIPRLTYDSHNYNKASQMHQEKEIFENDINFQLIRNTSREKLPSKKQRKEFINNCLTNRKNSNETTKLLTKKTKKYITGGMLTSTTQNSYSIHFTDTELQSGFDKNEHSIVVPIEFQSDRVLSNEGTQYRTTYAEMDSIVPNNIDSPVIEITGCREISDHDEKSQNSHYNPINCSGTEFQSGLYKNQHDTPIESDAVVPINEETHIGSMNNTMDSIVPNLYDNTRIQITGHTEIPNYDGKSHSQSVHFSETELLSGLDRNQHNTIEFDAVVPMNEKTEFGSTYTIIDSSKVLNDFDNTGTETRGIGDNLELDRRDRIAAPLGNIHNCDSGKTPDHQTLLNNNTITVENNDCNVVFVSTSQYFNEGLNSNGSIDPHNMCEPILGEQSSGEYNFIFNSINKVLEPNNFKCPEIYTNINNHNQGDYNHYNDGVQSIDKETNHDVKFNFNINNRRRYIPKGLSPIFENCNSKKVCTYEIDEDYFEENVYNNFVQDVQVNTEIFEPMIQDIKEIVSKDIEKVNNRLIKQNACLTFNTDSLKEAQVLGQVDHKFIAAVIKDMKERKGHMVLFDQHAVHERIRLETNMREYLRGDQWKSTALDGISLHLSKDDILYLHNCKDKFYRLGLEWNILNNTEVAVTAIPEAILGKNIRQVDVVLKSVKRLIKEVIGMIKEQGGCVSVYPKSIMDLVFSEACRYAIMFGDALSKDECSNMLNALSECKTPFQCAHGRPVMAVLTDLKTEKRPYKVNFARIQQFRRRLQKYNKTK